MRYCYSCKRLTAGDPLFCAQCGSTYDVRLCPRLHPNPRGARVCAQCGSHDLSTPQPRRSALTNLWFFLVLRLPGVILLLLSVWLFLAMLSQLLTNQEVQGHFFGALLLLGIAWWAYTQLPTPIRHGLSRLVRRRRRNGRH
jgi:RNA polymerase subunit RPABC4/transcription elongation factor Spt4